MKGESFHKSRSKNEMKKKVVVNDLMQKNYSYFLIEPTGKNFNLEFKPTLTPKEMLKLGVFGGKYMTDCKKEFPKEWFTDAKLCKQFHDASLNYYKINASQPLSEWRKKGWIHPQDPRGWFQWYCRYHMGRRIPEEDLRQIKRWKSFIARHIGGLLAACKTRDQNCRAKERQALLHWAVDSRKI